MANLAKYLAWLKWLASLSANAPAFLSAALAFWEAIKKLLPAKPEEAGLELTQAITGTNQVTTDEGAAMVAEVVEAETDVLALCEPVPGEGKALAVRDGSRLREIFAFLKMLADLFAGFGG